MTRRALALLLAVAGSVFAAPAAPDALAAHHGEGDPCPDGDEGAPCAPDCPCTCCPGHAPAAFPGPGAGSPSHLPVGLHRPLPDADEDAADHERGVFRPPRPEPVLH